MVGSPNVRRLRRACALLLGLAWGFAYVRAAQPISLSLQEVGRRTGPDLVPVHLNEKVMVQGVVNATAYHFPEYSVLAIQDDKGSAAVLKSLTPGNRLDAFHPGDEIEAQGTVTFYAGAVTIVPDAIQVLGPKPPPVPFEISIHDLQNVAYQGRLVHTIGHVKQVGDTTAGGQLVVDDLLKVFMPRPHERPLPNFNDYNPGDEVQLTGIAYQYCIHAPYTTGFEVLVHDPTQAIRTGPRWSLSPTAVASGLTGVLLIAFLLWSREHRLRNQRERLRRTYQLGEEILGSATAEGILQRIAEALPGILQVSRVHLYAYNRSAKTLDSITDEPAEPVSISLSSPPAGTQAGAVACFHYRTLLVIPDIDRSPFPIAGKPGEKTPKSLLFVPMLAQAEVIGVMQLDQDDRVRDFTPDEQALAQHLGNQIGVAIRLLDQRSVQEQLSRTEKLAAVGRLISGVVNELQTPLSSISDLAKRALEKSHTSPAEREVAAIAAEARKAAAMVARLVSFAAAEQVEARQVSVGNLLKNLIDFREGDWKASGIRVRNLTSHEPLYVLGSHGQLEQVFLNLLVHAEQSLAEAPQKVITIRTSVLGKRLLVEIAFTAPAELRKPEETAAVLGVTRSVVAGHGGEVRLIDKSNADPHFEVELPISIKDRSAPASSSAGSTVEFSRRMTALVIEPDEAAQRQLLGLLSTRGYRVVPVTNSDNGLELAQRMRFDAAFCSVHADGLNWVELSERMHSRVGGFILLSDGYDAELSSDFEGDGRFVLPKPVQEAELERVLRSIDRLASAKVVPIIKNGVA
jgi:GAF domain-containing protein/CheY-like chemotaxis protein